MPRSCVGTEPTRPPSPDADWHTTPYLRRRREAECVWTMPPGESFWSLSGRLGQKGPSQTGRPLAKDRRRPGGQMPWGYPKLHAESRQRAISGCSHLRFRALSGLKIPDDKINRVTNGSALTDKVLDKLIDQGSTGYIKTQLQRLIAPTITRRRCSFHSSARSATSRGCMSAMPPGDFDTYTMVGRVGETDARRTPNSSKGSDASFPASTRLSRRGLTGWATPTSFSSGGAGAGQKCAQWFEIARSFADGKEAMVRANRFHRVNMAAATPMSKMRTTSTCTRHARRCGPPNPAEIWTSAGPARHWSSPI